MTTNAVDYRRRLDRIHERGYWRIVIRPTVFDEHRIPTLAQCWQIIATAMINLRGLDYPEVPPNERVEGSDWVQSGGEFGDGIEVWRLYRSGQFVHTFSVQEDFISPWEPDGTAGSADSEEAPRLNIFNALFTLTEVLEFARNLAHRDVLHPAALVRVELHGMKGRRLVAPQSMWSFGTYVSAQDIICWQVQLLPVELIAAAPKRALDASIYVFDRFGWRNPPRETLEYRQRRLLERQPYTS